MDKIFVCIGSPNFVFDSLGPYVGTKLKDLGYEVIGTMEEPVHGTNMKDYWEVIKKLDKQNVISIDSALSKIIEPGKLVHRYTKGVVPRAGVDKSFNDIEIGSSSIIGVVGEDINNVITSENEIKEMADDIVNYAINLYPKTIQ